MADRTAAIQTRIATPDDAEALARLITAFNIPYPGKPVTAAQAAARLWDVSEDATGIRYDALKR